MSVNDVLAVVNDLYATGGGLVCMVTFIVMLAATVINRLGSQLVRDNRAISGLQNALIDEKIKRSDEIGKSKRQVMLGADGELLEVISDGERSEAVHVGFHDESPYKTPSPDSEIPFSTWIDEENDNEFWS